MENASLAHQAWTNDLIISKTCLGELVRPTFGEFFGMYVALAGKWKNKPCPPGLDPSPQHFQT